jgi:hypothetical protein
LPAPRKPVTIVTGIFAIDCCILTSADSRGHCNRSGASDQPLTAPRQGTPPVAFSTVSSAGILACGSSPGAAFPERDSSGYVGVRISTYSCGGSCGLDTVSRIARIPV